MTMRGKSIMITVITGLILISLAFGIQSGKAYTLTPRTRETAAKPAIEEPLRLHALSPDEISRLARATVRISGMKMGKKREYPIFNGSGTILTPDGIILTNCHVANPKAMGYKEDMWVDSLVVSLLVDADSPPLPTYHAERLAYDSKLDLAVIKITETLDGSAVAAGKLNLPYVALGDSDAVVLGANLNVFGYPSIGGETITYTTGIVSGFDTEEPMGSRAWIKTAAMIAGGNSGGLAANDEGLIVGVPTRGGTASAERVTDCRRIEDTNGDGTINDKDTCIPFGGFINGIRPIKWALPLIEAAKKGETYQSPFTKKKTTHDPSAKKKFTLIGWSTAEPTACKFDKKEQFDAGVQEVFAVFKPNDAMKEGDEIKDIWYFDNEKVSSDSTKYRPADCIWYALSGKGGETLPAGAYRLELYMQKNIIGEAEITVGGGASKKTTSGGVALEGMIKNSATGKPISGITVIVLKPGVDASDWVETSPKKDVYSQAVSDRSGMYRMPDKLERGETYPVIFGGAKDNYRIRFGTLTVPKDADDTERLDVELSELG